MVSPSQVLPLGLPPEGPSGRPLQVQGFPCLLPPPGLTSLTLSALFLYTSLLPSGRRRRLDFRKLWPYRPTVLHPLSSGSWELGVMKALARAGFRSCTSTKPLPQPGSMGRHNWRAPQKGADEGWRRVCPGRPAAATGPWDRRGWWQRKPSPAAGPGPAPGPSPDAPPFRCWPPWRRCACCPLVISICSIGATIGLLSSTSHDRQGYRHWPDSLFQPLEHRVLRILVELNRNLGPEVIGQIV